MLGAVLKPHPVPGVLLIYRKLVVTGSSIGGIRETQEIDVNISGQKAFVALDGVMSDIQQC